MGSPRQSTTEWKRENGLRSINFCIPISLLQELDWLKNDTGSSRSEMIRSGIIMYIRSRKREMLDYERQQIEERKIHQKKLNNQVNTGLLPDY